MIQKLTMHHVVILLWIIRGIEKGTSLPCILKDYGEENRVCVCNANYCDTIERVPTINEGETFIFISSKGGLRFHKTIARLNGSSHKPNNLLESSGSTDSVRFTVNNADKYQTIIGFGGAFTDSAGINILSLGKQTQEYLLRSYFSENGIEYNLGRIPISGTDFSTHPYTYDDGPPDPLLNRFSLAKEDLKYKIPIIQRAMSMSVKTIHMVAASWSPPPWMKTNNKYSGFGFLKEKYYNAYANYLLRFLEEYKKHEIKVWALSTGNEPSNGILPVKGFNSLGWTPVSITNWIVQYLGPQLKKSMFNDTLLLAFDDQRLFLPWWINLMVRDNKNVLEYIDGFAVHWYWDFLIGVEVINSLHERYPNKFVLYTEASIGDKPWEEKVKIGSWERGEQYIADIIENINAWVTGWMDWNLALDIIGGPSWAKNYVDSPILVNSTADEFYKQPMFYALGHVSKFIERDAVRIEISPTYSKGVHAMAVENPNGRIVIVMLNKNNEQTEVSLHIVDKGWINVELPLHSFVTILC